jgi:NADH-quinone oxidoreductase subunit E
LSEQQITTSSDEANPTLSESHALTLSDDFVATADRLVRRYPVARSALLPLLHLVQSEHGYVSEEGIAFCAERLALTRAEVGAVATFYTMFKRQPVGDYLLSVCCNPTCQVAGAQTIFERYRDELGGRLTDPETQVSIEEAECLGICDAAPVVQVNYEMYGPLTDEEADRLLDGCRKGQPPVSSWSGEPAPSFREVERELSGANDAFLDANVAAAYHSVADHEVPPMYKSGETDIPVTAPGGDPGGHGGEVFAAAFGAVGSGNGRGPAAAAVEAAEAAPAPDEQAGADGSSLQVEGKHHPDAVAEPDTSGATTDVTDTSLPATGRDPQESGDATLPTPGDERPAPEGTTAPEPGAPAPDPEEANPAVGGDQPEVDEGAAATPESGSEPAARRSDEGAAEDGGERPAAQGPDDADRPDGAAEEDH